MHKTIFHNSDENDSGITKKTIIKHKENDEKLPNWYLFFPEWDEVAVPDSGTILEPKWHKVAVPNSGTAVARGSGT